jgi:cytoplasmic iron level regulating protein YaaA (DUF328/UPF0246 family)
MSTTIALVACVSKKNKTPMPARDLYISDWFKKASSYADSISDQWFILSAKYGLLDPDDVVEPYDETLNKMPVNQRRSWSKKVLEDLIPKLNVGDQVVVLAGMKYREFLVSPISSKGIQVKIPMEGLRIGEQLSWLSKHLG